MGLQWVHGFTKSLGLILCSEVGDKTFIIAALMAMKHSRRMVRRLHTQHQGHAQPPSPGVCRSFLCGGAHDGALGVVGLGGTQLGTCTSRAMLILSHSTSQLPRNVVHYAATVLFFFFGARLLYDGVLNKTEVRGS